MAVIIANRVSAGYRHGRLICLERLTKRLGDEVSANHDTTECEKGLMDVLAAVEACSQTPHLM